MHPVLVGATAGLSFLLLPPPQKVENRAKSHNGTFVPRNTLLQTRATSFLERQMQVINESRPHSTHFAQAKEEADATASNTDGGEGGRRRASCRGRGMDGLEGKACKCTSQRSASCHVQERPPVAVEEEPVERAVSSYSDGVGLSLSGQ
jgi:hypothetical protein